MSSYLDTLPRLIARAGSSDLFPNSVALARLTLSATPVVIASPHQTRRNALVDFDRTSV